MKLSLFLCAVFLLSQTEALYTNQNEKNNGMDIIDLVKMLVKATEKVIDYLLSSAEEMTKLTPDTFDAFRMKIINKAKDILSIFLDKALKEFEAAGSKGTDSGKKLTSCIVSARDDLLNLPVTFWENVSKCSESELLSMVKDLEPIINDLKELQVDGVKVADKIDKCDGKGMAALICIGGVVGDLAKLAAEIPEKISPDLGPLLMEIIKVIDSTNSCVKTNIPVYESNASKVFDKIAACYDK